MKHNKIIIRDVFKEDQRIDVAFINQQTRNKLNLDLSKPKERVYLKGTINSLLLIIKTNRKCENNSIHLNFELKKILGDLIEAKKAGFLIKAKFSIRDHAFGFFLSFISGIIAGFLANWIWSPFSP